MSFLVVNIAAPWQLASENIASLDFFPRLDIVLSGRAPDCSASALPETKSKFET